MNISTSITPKVDQLKEIADPVITNLLGISNFVVVQLGVFMLGNKVLALDDMKLSQFPGRFGLVQNGDRLLIAIGCRDSHGGIVERACAAAAKVHGGNSGYEKKFGGGLFVVNWSDGSVQTMGTSGDLGSVKDSRVSEFAAARISELVRECYFPKA